MDRRLMPLILALTLLAAVACGEDAPRPSPISGALTIQLGDRPFALYVPSSYTSGQPVPLVVGLHGFGSYSAEMNSYFSLTGQADERGFLVAMPDGTVDGAGREFWNATDVCCDLLGSGVDDSTYLSDVIKAVTDAYDVQGVFLIGHSNGAYMAHRMACEHADQITAIAALAGVPWLDPARCMPSRPVSVLQIHGTQDGQVPFQSGPGRPGAEETVALWRSKDGCTDAVDTTTPALDLDEAVPGAETTVTTYADGCAAGARVALWRMEGSRHVPTLTDAFTPAVLDFLYDSLPA